jgi:hypothetical protein
MIITTHTNILSEATHSHMQYLFQNVHKSRKTVHDLLDSRQNTIDILFIQEAPINFIHKVPSATNPEGNDLKGPVHHKAWQCINRCLTFDDSAVAIYLNKHIMSTHQAIVNNTPVIHKDVLVVQVTSNKLKNMDFTLVNVYNRPGSGNKAIFFKSRPPSQTSPSYRATSTSTHHCGMNASPGARALPLNCSTAFRIARSTLSMTGATPLGQMEKDPSQLSTCSFAMISW